MIVADTGAVLALLDKNDRHHRPLRKLFDLRPDQWLLPWAILPEVDYLAGTELGARAQEAFLADVVEGLFHVEHSLERDFVRAQEIHGKYRALQLGLVDSIVMAIAERLRADTIATLDLRHFGAVKLASASRLVPRDL